MVETQKDGEEEKSEGQEEGSVETPSEGELEKEDVEEGDMGGAPLKEE